jgi:hypothetical protein
VDMCPSVLERVKTKRLSRGAVKECTQASELAGEEPEEGLTHTSVQTHEGVFKEKER